MIKLSIIIPLFNHEKYIEKVLESFLSINLSKEILITDDGSTDSSAYLVEKLVESNSEQNIIFSRQRNQGAVKTILKLLEKTTGEFIYIGSSDDVCDPRGIENAVSILNNNPHYHLLIGNAKIIESHRAKVNDVRYAHGQRHKRFFEKLKDQPDCALFLNLPSPFLVQACLLRRSSFSNVVLYDDELQSDDLQFWLRLFSSFRKEGIDFIFVPSINITNYRLHANNLHKNLELQLTKFIQTILCLCPNYLISKAISIKTAYYLITAMKYFKIKEAFKVAHIGLNHVNGLKFIDGIFYVLANIFHDKK